MGSDARGAAATQAPLGLDMITGKSDTAAPGSKARGPGGRKAFHKGGEQSIVDTLDAVAVGKESIDRWRWS